jgi:hypothetical protein
VAFGAARQGLAGLSGGGTWRWAGSALLGGAHEARSCSELELLLAGSMLLCCVSFGRQCVHYAARRRGRRWGSWVT